MMESFFVCFAFFLLPSHGQYVWRPPMAYNPPMSYVQGVVPRKPGVQEPMSNLNYYITRQNVPIDSSNTKLFRTIDEQRGPDSSWYRPFGGRNPYAGPVSNMDADSEFGMSMSADIGMNIGWNNVMNDVQARDMGNGPPNNPYTSVYDRSYDDRRSLGNYPGMQAFYVPPYGVDAFYTPEVEIPKFLSLKRSTPYQAACNFHPKPGRPKCICGVEKTHRIYGGEQADIKAHPWMAGVFSHYSDLPMCGATIISNYWVISAAHCFDASFFPTKDFNLKVRVGEYSVLMKERAEQEFTVKRVVSHKNFDRTTGQNDIALLELDKPIKFNFFVSPICLPFQFRNCTWEGYDILVAGWGNTENGQPAAILRETNIPVMSLEDCKQRFTVVNELSLCAYAEGKDTCQGDSGGPALIYLKDHVFLAGVVSWGIGCGKSGSPGVYTNVAKFMDWIQEKTGNTRLCNP